MSFQVSYINRIGQNTLLLYLRMIIVTCLNLYTLRLVLSGLGIKDYGIFDVVAGLITIAMSIGSALSSSTLRYYSINMEDGKSKIFSLVFSASLAIHILISLFILILGESFGVWFLNNHLVIPPDRINVANSIFHFSLLSFIFTFLHAPFSSAIIAFDNIKAFTFISFFEGGLKFLAALILLVVKSDKLYFYGLSLFVISSFIFLTYVFLAKREYNNYLNFVLPDLNTIKQLMSFSGWSFFGSTASVSVFQIITILINLFFGPLTNSARAISIQFNMLLSSFTSSFIMGLKSPMIKSYAIGSFEEVNYMFYLSNKIIYYSLLVVCIPLFFEMDTILNLWLNVKDKQVVLFSKLILIYSIIMALNNPISIIIQAIGKVKEYHISVEIFIILVLPITYLLFYFDFPAYTTYIVLIFGAFFAHLVRLSSLKKFYLFYSHRDYLNFFAVPATAITTICVFLGFLFNRFFHGSFISFFSLTFLSLIFVLFFVYFFNFTDDEKKFFKFKIFKQS